MAVTLRIRLTRKLAAVVNGVDISSLNTGDVIELPVRAAAMLISEGWAERVEDSAPASVSRARVAPPT
jgi:hypothetical protein